MLGHQITQYSSMSSYHCVGSGGNRYAARSPSHSQRSGAQAPSEQQGRHGDGGGGTRHEAVRSG